MPRKSPGITRLFRTAAALCVAGSVALTMGCSAHQCFEKELSNCGGPPQSRPIPFEQWQKYELYFGLARPDGTEIPAAEFDRFVNDQITPRFPDGLTLIETRGQWRGKGQKLIRENGRLLVILAPRGDAPQQKLADIREAYKRAFSQDSVLIVTQPAGVSF